MKRWLVALALAVTGCEAKDSAPAVVDSGAFVDDDAGIDAALPPLDPAACPKVTGDEAPLTFARDYVPLVQPGASSLAPIETDKAFYLFTVLERAAGVDAVLAADATLAAIATDREARFRNAVDSCPGDLACVSAAVTWSDADAQAAANALVVALKAAGLLDVVVHDHLRPSGMFNLHAADSDEAMVHDAFVDTIAALNGTLSSVGPQATPDALSSVLRSFADAYRPPLRFHRPLLLAALAAMSAAVRDEAARYEPLAKLENAKAIARIPTIDFGAFPFAAIIVPGLGPNSLDTPLSDGGRDRCDLAAARFAAKLAPLIVLSGGHVHPDRTPYSEAIEMKKYLMSAHGIAEDAILVDPHARHTTTNLRNVSRLFFRYGMPIDRPSLVTTDLGQTLYMQTTGFPLRNDTELGYRPWRVLFTLSSNDTCFVPTKMSLHADGRDPLDP